MLDTNMVSHLMRNPAGKVTSRIAQAGEASICVSIITAAELRFGAAKQASARLRERVEAVLARVKVLPLDAPTDAAYAAIRAGLEPAGRPIAPNDLLIAAHAMAVGATVVTGNVAEFSRVPGLTVENWIT
jgi:tRNA(fMet)-specific endonuclease VapC